jgi:hypothetical protein
MIKYRMSMGLGNGKLKKLIGGQLVKDNFLRIFLSGYNVTYRS